jgi:transcription elongation factor GreA
MEFVTQQEKAQIEARLQALVSNRPIISRRIAEARELGDLKENGDYHAAREQQGVDEAEIRRLTDRISNISVISEAQQRATEGVVFIGSTVKIKDLNNGKTEVVKLVGEMSENPSDDVDEVTATSPMGEALMKARVGDSVRYSAPRGEKRYQIVEIN